MKKLLYIMSVTTLLLGLTACGSKDDFTDSIFDTSIKPVDPDATTYEFDQWLYDNFTKPYNVEFQYKFNLNASDYSFQLAPAAYDKSQLLAYFIKHLFYDVYIKFAGEDFMKQYGPRIFHFIGSSGYSPLTGTEVLGLASGGVKITLYNLNEMKPYVKGTTVYNAEDIEVLNEKYFHTMHHEFSHIMHQTKSYPVTFGQVTSGTYDPIDWHKRDSVESHRLGYVTHYASSANYEDFVETLSCIITDDDYRWMMRIINACAPGWRAGDKEEVIKLITDLGIDMDKSGTHWNNFKLYTEKEYNSETGAYDIDTHRIVLDVHRSDEKVVNKEHTAEIKKYQYTLYKSFTKFTDFLDWVPVSYDDQLAGINAMLKKISIATTWQKDRWSLNTFALRKEVHDRQDNLNTFLKDNVTIYELK
jgi:substrate import-associated zinc metallohydrolase lipoprotein